VESPTGAPGVADGTASLLVARALRIVLGTRPVLDGLNLAVAAGSVHAWCRQSRRAGWW
jgi:hypothetical protein